MVVLGLLQGCDVTDIESTLRVIEERVARGFPKYEPEIITLDFKAKTVTPAPHG